MVKKKKARKTASTRTVYRTKTVKAARRRSTSGTKYIPAAAATVGLVAANANIIKTAIYAASTWGIVPLVKNAVTMKEGTYGAKIVKAAIQPDQLIMDGVGLVGGMIAGEAVKKYAPSVIKTPLGKIAKKIPRVI